MAEVQPLGASLSNKLTLRLSFELKIWFAVFFKYFLKISGHCSPVYTANAQL